MFKVFDLHFSHLQNKNKLDVPVLSSCLKGKMHLKSISIHVYVCLEIHKEEDIHF